jgi:small subunit ribosomal protein S21
MASSATSLSVFGLLMARKRSPERLDSGIKRTKVTTFDVPGHSIPHNLGGVPPSHVGMRSKCCMALVRLENDEPVEGAIRRFKKLCEKAGILAELRKHEHCEKPSVRRK